ncbi:MAG: type I-C CRISPR-associated protein Cas5 [Candidatus Accumulibacter sp.]|uniref:type I-C CRISPR-associated protein Cas5c n=1 Tax=Accumulibacter sp. TaxID=2053492 RepID=UPI001A4E9028|nr:type I-C CRISPR-associated protein Cas5c [Accumulibacter sp.]MBL8393415.1 type I-C CRISPR-associated protein Cas5 [Accumulibacter sp.]
MSEPERTRIEFRTWGRFALFTDPVSRVGGEKCSYHIPTYEALKGIAKSIYWKPTLIWVIDAVRVMKLVRTQTKGTKPLNFGGGNSLAIYTFLSGVEYQVRAHFEWNEQRVELQEDRIEAKHVAIMRRTLERGGRQDIFLGTRDCQGYAEPCVFGCGEGAYDQAGVLAFGLTFHGFDYPDETGKDELRSRFWMPRMENGVIRFIRPEDCTTTRFVREMSAKNFRTGRNLRAVEREESEG